MRRRVHDQLHLVPAGIAHVHAQELERMSAILETLPQATMWVRDDLLHRGSKRVNPNRGREGMTADQVLRAMIIKQIEFSYEQLAFHLADSTSYRAFCRIGISEVPPTKSRLQKNIKRVSAKTWARINRDVIHYADELQVESGRKVRTDCTVVESNIHEPSDSSLLLDCVRVLVRLMTVAKEDFGRSVKLPGTTAIWEAPPRACCICSSSTGLRNSKPLWPTALAVRLLRSIGCPYPRSGAQGSRCRSPVATGVA